MPPTGNARERQRIVKVLFGVAALISLMTGLMVYLFADTIGLDDFTAKVVAVAFLIAGASDYLVLHYWERFFKAKR